MGKIYRIPAQKVEVGLLECRNGFGTLKTTDTGADFPVFACTEVFENPKATASTGCLGATALPSGAATTVTEGITQPDYPRSLQMVASAAATSVVTAYGYDQFGNAINEEFTLNGTSDVLGTKVFASITERPISTGTTRIIPETVARTSVFAAEASRPVVPRLTMSRLSRAAASSSVALRSAISNWWYCACETVPSAQSAW